MVETKTVAERLRDYALHRTNTCTEFRKIATGTKNCFDIDCSMCRRQIANELADMIEAEQANAVSKALKSAKPQLPEGVIWPTYEDGELVKFGEKLGREIGSIEFYEDSVTMRAKDGTNIQTDTYGTRYERPEPEVLDADRVPIHVGDTVYDVRDGSKWTVSRIENADMVLLNNAHQVYVNNLTHRKPDTQEDIEKDCGMEAYEYLNKRGICPSKKDYDGQKAWKRDCRRLQKLDLLERQRKLLGGE